MIQPDPNSHDAGSFDLAQCPTGNTVNLNAYDGSSVRFHVPLDYEKLNLTGTFAMAHLSAGPTSSRRKVLMGNVPPLSGVLKRVGGREREARKLIDA